MRDNKNNKIMREINLTKEGEAIFYNANVKEDDIQNLIKKYSVKKVDNVNYVLCDRKRDSGENPDFMGTKKALAGILQKNETLSDFVEFKLRMKPVCKFRNNDFIIDAIKRKIRKNEKKK